MTIRTSSPSQASHRLVEKRRVEGLADVLAAAAGPPRMMWGVAYQTPDQAEGEALVSYLDGSMTEQEATDLAEKFAQRSNVLRAWPVISERW